eukprot:CAMPEP_0201515732 /NCGR_PEP_ID=MMETSP0161_2-20130828/7220_1 /ASSEMBLY_ACC=CAM_ASM_000251 /TAXON_ID=180227 /ORGANISM="Neoparamoeba aestuarina, Strain SoJaBio B1-5/56/2" /LENGTH=295 /DNA_ID=CAMNT_0047912637 /DNA_START=42 /DNA_END=929 /DNA_ORIENTATION=-
MKEYDKLLPKHIDFVSNQHVFFVATAPDPPGAHVNVSPKGLENSFIFVDGDVARQSIDASPEACKRSSKSKKIIYNLNEENNHEFEEKDEHWVKDNAKCYVCYMDTGGSGAETAAHLQQNGRMVVMFCNFEEGSPNILRFWGCGYYVIPSDQGFHVLLDHFDKNGALAGAGRTKEDHKLRGIVLMAVDRIRDSCGYGVPLMPFLKQRSVVKDRSQKESAEGMLSRRKANNYRSLDNLVGNRTYYLEEKDQGKGEENKKEREGGRDRDRERQTIFTFVGGVLVGFALFYGWNKFGE